MLFLIFCQTFFSTTFGVSSEETVGNLYDDMTATIRFIYDFITHPSFTLPIGVDALFQSTVKFAVTEPI
jgi:hypothetical protein